MLFVHDTLNRRHSGADSYSGHSCVNGGTPPIFLTPSLGVMMTPEVSDGKAEFYAGLQARGGPEKWLASEMNAGIFFRFLIAVVTATMVACNNSQEAKNNSSLRQQLIEAGADHLVSTLQSYPVVDAEMVRSNADHELLIEIVKGTVKQPEWLTPSGRSYSVARDLAIYYLAIDHQNEHLRLAPSEALEFRAHARQKLVDSSTSHSGRMEAVEVLSAVGDTSDVDRIEQFGMQSEDQQDIQRSIISLALMCSPGATDSLARVLASKRSLIPTDLQSQALKMHDGKKTTMCKGE